MVNLTEREKIEILMMVGYGDRKRTQLEVCDLFNETYPNRQAITQSCVSKLVKTFNRTGSINSRPRSGRPKTTSAGEKALDILLDVQENPKRSLRHFAIEHNVSHQSVNNLFRAEKMHPYKSHLVQELNEEDFYRRSEFCETVMERCNADVNFANNILFSDEATFMLHGFISRHNFRHWAAENPRCVIEAHTQRPEKVNVWVGIIGRNTIGPFFIDGNLTTEVYLQLLRDQVIPHLEVMYPDNNIWFQQDGAPAHFGLPVRNFLNHIFPNRWIGRGGEIEWPARSPDLNPLDFFMWGFLKNKVYYNRPHNIEDLKNRIRNEIGNIVPDMLERVIEEFKHRLGYCLANNGEQFEHLIK